MSFAERAIGYARRCVSGEEVVCEATRLAARRMLADLERKDWRWRFSPALADHACRFIEMMPVIDGGADRDLRLDDWQCFVVANAFGWAGADSVLRFVYVTLFIGRGNAKSYLASAIANYVLFGRGQESAKGYCAASDRKTARYVLDTSRDMWRLRPRVRNKLGVVVGANALTNDRGCQFVSLSSDQDNNWGQRTAIAVIDELHVVDPKVFAAISTALGKRKNGLLLSITTAGFAQEGLAYDKRQLVQSILEGKTKAERHFCCVWEADDTDDLQDRREWKKANPALGSFLDEDTLQNEADQAVSDFDRLTFRTFRLNRYTKSAGGWLSLEKWNRPGLLDPALRLEDFAGKPCFVGLDLALARDMTSKAYVFPEERDDGVHFTVFQTSYLPEARKGERPEFAAWEREGRLTFTPGDVTDLQLVEDEVRSDLERFDVQQVCFDKQHAGQMMARLQSDGVPVMEVPQTARGLSEPMKFFETAVLVPSPRVHHSGDPLLAWAVGNTSQFVSAQGNVFPEKVGGDKSSGLRIDPVVAVLTAMAQAKFFGDSEASFSPFWV